jgi:GNAT superfamily N-acetyltransferase
LRCIREALRNGQETKVIQPKTPPPAKPRLQLRIEPLTLELWPALEDLFGEKGACNGCWCMYWRIGAAYRRRASELNRKDFEKIVNSGPPPGLLAFDGDRAVGWCQITPRDALPWLNRTWRLRRIDELPVWSISCFYVRIGYRRQGVSSTLIRAAVEMARQAKAPAVEAYPLDSNLSPSATSTGYASPFARAGFKEVARHSPERPIMRYELSTCELEAMSIRHSST